MEAFLGRRDQSEAEALLRRCLREAQKAEDTHKVLELSMLLGELLLMAGRIGAGMHQFRRVLKSDSGNVRALLGLADAYISRGWINAAERCLDTAQMAVKNQPCIRAQIDLLDRRAFLASQEGNDATLQDSLSRICDLLELSDESIERPLALFDILVEEGKAVVALPYLERLVGNVVVKGDARRWLNIAARLLIEAYNYAGLSGKECRVAVNSLVERANPPVRREFRKAAYRRFESKE